MDILILPGQGDKKDKKSHDLSKSQIKSLSKVWIFENILFLYYITSIKIVFRIVHNYI